MLLAALGCMTVKHSSLWLYMVCSSAGEESPDTRYLKVRCSQAQGCFVIVSLKQNVKCTWSEVATAHEHITTCRLSRGVQLGPCQGPPNRISFWPGTPKPTDSATKYVKKHQLLECIFLLLLTTQ